MDNRGGTLVVIALALVALAAFAFYRWHQRKRVSWVQGRVREYLVARYGVLPTHLDINCSEDPLWPVLVSFDSPRAGFRHTLQFSCSGSASTFSLLSEKEEGR
jgi:hypothetical protein